MFHLLNSNFALAVVVWRLLYGGTAGRCRDCYDSYDEWNAYQEKKKLQMDEWKQKVLSAIGLESNLKGITVQQVQTEVFAIVRIWKMNG